MWVWAVEAGEWEQGVALQGRRVITKRDQRMTSLDLPSYHFISLRHEAKR